MAYCRNRLAGLVRSRQEFPLYLCVPTYLPHPLTHIFQSVGVGCLYLPTYCDRSAENSSLLRSSGLTRDGDDTSVSVHQRYFLCDPLLKERLLLRASTVQDPPTFRDGRPWERQALG